MIVYDLKRILGRYPQSTEDLVPLLEALVSTQGWLSPELLQTLALFCQTEIQVLQQTAKTAGLPLKPPGKKLIRVCVGRACKTHSAALLQNLAKNLGLLPGKTSADGQYSLETVDCLGRCSLPPGLSLDGAPISTQTLLKNLGLPLPPQLGSTP